MYASSNFETYLVTVATATSTDVIAAIKTLLSKQSLRISKVLISEFASPGTVTFRVSHTSAGAATVVGPAAGVAAAGNTLVPSSGSLTIDFIDTDPKIFIHHAGGIDITFCVQIWR